MGFSLRVEGPCSPKESLLDYKSDAGQTAGRTFLIERVERPQKAGLVKSLQLADTDTQLLRGRLRAGGPVSTQKISFVFVFKAKRT